MGTYNPHNLTKVFAGVKDYCGNFNPHLWPSSMQQFPNDMDDSERESVYQAILDDTDKYFLNRKPKSWQSLAMQVAICLSTQKSDDMEQSSIETRGRNRIAAYTAGFLTMEDIIYLENKEKTS